MLLKGTGPIRARMLLALTTCALLLCACTPAAKTSTSQVEAASVTVSKVPASEITSPVRTDKTTDAAYLTLLIASDQLTAGSDQLAVISYSNNRNEPVTVSTPLDASVRITDSNGQLVSEFRATRPDYPVESSPLAAGDTRYNVVRFTVPEAGSYSIVGAAEDLETDELALTAVP